MFGVNCYYLFCYLKDAEYKLIAHTICFLLLHLQDLKVKKRGRLTIASSKPDISPFCFKFFYSVLNWQKQVEVGTCMVVGHVHAFCKMHIIEICRYAEVC